MKLKNRKGKKEGKVVNGVGGVTRVIESGTLDLSMVGMRMAEKCALRCEEVSVEVLDTLLPGGYQIMLGTHFFYPNIQKITE